MTHTRLTRRRMLALSGGASAVALAGCLAEDDGQSGDNGTTGELGDPADSATFEATTEPNADFNPNIVHIEAGGTVEWVGLGLQNRAVAYHPETHGPQRIPEGTEPWSSDLLREGDTFKLTFETEGIYDFADPTTFCSTHEAVGAVGRIVVGWPDLDSEPAMQHDPEELPSRAATVMSNCNEECKAVLDGSEQ